jgi:iron complex transport system substrate-binding protein
MHTQRTTQVSRRAVVGAAIATVAAGGLRGAHHAAAQATPATGTRTVTDHAGRTVEIPTNPQRVITMSLPILEIALSVGITPVGTASFATVGGIPDYFGDAANDIEVIGDTEFDFEKVVALKPDLAIMDYFGDQDAETVETMQQICPIVTVGEFRDNWRDDSAQVAEYLNRREAFRAVEARYDARIAEITAGLAPDWTGKTVALLRFRAADMRILKKNSFAGNVLADVGLTFPEIADSGAGIAEDFSWEQARLVDVNALFVVRDSGDEADGAFTAGVTSPIFQSLNVVKSNRVYTVDQVAWITLRGYGASEILLDDIEKYLIDDEPAPALPS